MKLIKQVTSILTITLLATLLPTNIAVTKAEAVEESIVKESSQLNDLLSKSEETERHCITSDITYKVVIYNEVIRLLKKEQWKDTNSILSEVIYSKPSNIGIESNNFNLSDIPDDEMKENDTDDLENLNRRDELGSNKLLIEDGFKDKENNKIEVNTIEQSDIEINVKKTEELDSVESDVGFDEIYNQNTNDIDIEDSSKEIDNSEANDELTDEAFKKIYDNAIEQARNRRDTANNSISCSVKNVYGNSIDIDIAKGLLGTNGYNYILTDQGGFSLSQFTANDIIVGGPGATGGVGEVELNGAIRLWGSTRELTAEAIRNYIKSIVEPGREGVKNVYGNSIDIGNAKSILGANGYNYILTDQPGFSLPIFTSNDIIVGSTGAIGGVGEVELNGAIRLWGATRDLTAEAIRNYVRANISIKSMISNFILGIGDAGISAIEGGIEFLEQPLEKTKEMALAAAFLVTATQIPDSPEAKILNELISSIIKEAYYYNGDQWARFTGRCVGEIMLVLIADKGVSLATESLKMFSQSGRLGMLIENLKSGDKVDSVIIELRGSAEAINLWRKSTCSIDELYKYLKNIDSDTAEIFLKEGIWPSEIQVPKSSSVLDSDGYIDWS